MSSPVQMLWASCPCGSRILIVGYCATSVNRSLLGGFVPLLRVAIPLCNVTSLLRGYIWALPESLCWRPIEFGPSILFLFLELYMALLLISPRERAMGSTAFLCWLGVSSTLMSSAYVALMCCLSLVSTDYLVQPIQGIWPTVMLCMTLRSISKPDENTNFWGVVQIPNKWYPVVLAAVISLLSGRINWDLLVAIAFAHAHDRWRLDRLVVGRHWVDALDRRSGFLGGRLHGFLGGDWVPIGGCPSTEELEAGGAGTVVRPGSRTGQGQSPTTSSFHAFSGSGQRLGSS